MQASFVSRKAIAFLVFVFALFSGALIAEPRNVILLIGDGIGAEQVKAAGMYAYGAGGTLVFETLPRQGQMTTHSADNSVTDSAAAATAIATGVKVNNGVISMAYPGDGSELQTVLEYFRSRGKATGLVTTSYITDGTPAAFGAHEPSRTNEANIAQDYLTQTRPNVLFGGGGHGMTPSSAAAAGYTVVTDRDGLLGLDTESVSMVSAQFGDGYFPYEYDGLGSTYPHLFEMTTVALQILDNDPDGFFLMVEGGLIDLACHDNNLPRAIGEVLGFEDAVAAVLEWAGTRDDTLVIVTADHETGGLGVTRNNGQGAYPNVTWASTNHTGEAVPVYAWGPGSERICGTLDNTDLFAIAVAPSVELVTPPAESVVDSTSVDFSVRLYDQAGLVSASLYLGTAPKVLSFSGPDVTDDAGLYAQSPNSNFGTATSIKIDGDPHTHAVIKFPSLIGSGPNQIPPGSTVASATLKVRCTNAGNAMTMDRLLEDWNEGTVTWNSPWTNPGADGWSSRAGETVTASASATGWLSFDVTTFVQAWASGAPNYGIVFLDGGSDGVDLDSSESANPPVLSVEFSAGAWQEVAEQSLEGTSAIATFASQSLADGEEYVWNVLVTNAAGAAGWARANGSFRVDTGMDFPAQPALVSPADGAVGVSLSPTLSVQVSDPGSGPLDVSFYGRGGQESEEFAIAVLPDTQKYTLSDSANQTYFLSQTQWIAANLSALNIVFVTHVGDVVDDPDTVEMWERANLSMSALQDPVTGAFLVPYGIAPGNHDLPGTYGPTTYYNEYFPWTRYAGEPWYGGHYPEGGNENNYQFFSAGGDDYIALHLAYNSGGPTADVISWACGVLQANARRKAIVVTHAYLNTDGTRTAEGTAIWNSVVVPNENVFLVLCGHNLGEALRTDVLGSRKVYQVLVDYQGRSNGGDGWLRILKFAPTEGLLRAETYSPALDLYETDATSKFTLEVPMTGAVEIGKIQGVPSGEVASIVWTGLEEETRYDWFVRVANSLGRVQVGPTWIFRTGGADGTPPVISGVAAVSVTDHTATIVWTTDEPASSLVEYGLDENYGSSASEAGFVTEHSVTLSGLVAGSTYHYRVISADPSGNSASSGDDSFTTPADATAPAPPTGLAATAGDSEVALDWDDSFEPDLAGYNVYRATSQGGPYERLNASLLTSSQYADAGLTNGTTYYYVVTAVDTSSNESAPSNEVSATPADATAPAPPTGLAATAGDSEVALDWDDSSEPDLAGYNVYRATSQGGPYERLNASLLTSSQYADAGLTNGTTYYYVVTAVDVWSNESAYSSEVSATPLDATPPEPPTALAANAGDGVVSLSWTASVSLDVAGYNVYRRTESAHYGAPLNPVPLSGTSFQDTSVANGTTYYYVVTAVDTSSNESAPSNEVSATPADATAPAPPTGLAATAGDSEVALDWDDSSEPDLAGYNVYRATSQGGPYERLNASLLTSSQYADTGLTNGTTYYYVVTAVDVWSNESAYSSEVSATPSSSAYDAYVAAPPTVTFGTVSGGIEGTFAAGDGLVQAITEVPNGTGGRASLDAVYVLHTTAAREEITGLELHLSATWTLLEQGDPLVVRLWDAVTGGGTWQDISADIADGLFVVAGSAANYVDSGGNIQVRFSDSARIRGEGKDTLRVDLLYAHVISGPPDTTPPAAPTGLAASADSEGLLVDLAWTANSEPDLAGYKVYRSMTSGGDYVLVTPSPISTNTYADFVGAPGTYYYVVTAVDRSGNESGYSNEASATIEDLPPAAPAGLSAAAGDGSVSLNWSDNSEADLAGYNVYRSEISGGPYAKINGSLVAASAYVDTGVTNGTTYYYVVTAVDQAGKESPYSGEVSATPTGGGTATVHVESIVFGPFIQAGKNWKAQATVLVHDQADQPAAGATVTADWLLNGAVLQSGATGVTGSNGAVLLLSPATKAKSGDTFTLRITNVVLSGYTYDPSGVTSASAQLP